jgi:long-chain fatty acid transport protein
MQTFRAFGLENFTSSAFNFTNSTDNLTNRGNDWSFGGGYRLGWLGTYLDKRLDLGLELSPKVHMQKFNEYSGLFANDGEFDIPKNYTAGLSFKITPKTAVAFDYEQIYWSGVPSIGHQGPTTSGSNLGENPLCPGGNAGRSECQLGGALGMGFGWTNQKVYKFGIDHKYDKNLTLRAGYNYGRSPIPEDQVMFNMLAPATSDRHYTLGGTFAGKDDDITLTFMHSPTNIIKGPTMFAGGSAALSMSQTSLSIAYGLKF